MLGTFATNDMAEQPFGMLTYQVDRFNRILFGNAVATSQARMNNDFDRKELGGEHVDGAFHKLTDKKQHSLIMTALNYARQTTKEEAQALNKQRQHKLKTIETLKKAKILKATDEFTRSLILLEQYHSVACCKTKEEVTREYDKLTSETAKREAMKHQINIRTKGLG